MKRAPIHDFTFHPDYTHRSAVYCMNAWGAPCRAISHDEVFDSFDEAYEYARDYDANFAVPRPLKRGAIA